MSAELRQALEQVARRFRQVRLWGALAVCWASWAVLGLGLDHELTRPGAKPLPDGWLLASFAALAAATGLFCAVLTLRSVSDRRWVARRVEDKHPELGTGLLAAVEEDAAAEHGRLGYLQTAVVRTALEHRRTNDWDATVPEWSLLGVKLAHALALGALVVVAATLVGQVRTRAETGASLATGAGPSAVKVEPGDTALERGTTLLVVANFDGGVPADATLVVDDGTPTGRSSRPMARSLDDPKFAGRVESVSAELTYRVEFEGRTSPTYRVSVFEFPELMRTDATLRFPSYTSLGLKTVEDVRHVTAVEGTELTLLCRLNKAVDVARLVDEQGKVVPLAPRAKTQHAYETTFTLADSHRYKVQLVDKQGRSNRLPAEIVVNVTRNRPPVITMTRPSHDVRVSPVEELALAAQVEDDFGVLTHGLTYSVAGSEPKELAVKGPEAASKKVKAEHMLDFESFKAVPDQLVTYFVWAEDVGPDGKPRRTSGDMFFAEVRHFEEIFRQGEQPSGESAQNESENEQDNARQSEKLAELQKEVINGTWKVVRRETGAKPTATFAEDAKVLQEAQRSAIEQAEKLAGQLRDAESKANLAKATAFMKDAEGRLMKAAGSSSVPALSPALAAEQAAYQALLKLRAREFQVIRNNSRRRQSSSASAGSPSQQQLNQLELSDEENRYEEQRSARAQKEQLSQREQQQRESRQVINRLKELAQRQGDLNERLKEMQAALEAAKDQKTRDELERQLKRLRDQQQQVLRDTDELRERMEREENRDRMAEARQQLEQGREHVRQASEALEKGQVSQALTEGARAGRQLNDIKEELRKGAANRFSEDITEMRGQSRDLEDRQKKLTEQLDATSQAAQRSLRDAGPRRQVREGLEQQQKQLGGLLDRMKNTVQEAEETEPLLAKELFDAVRKANEKAIPDALKAAEQLADAGIAEEAVKSSRQAGQGLEQLREGVERAAKSVLGDETEALRRAQSELDDLADQVNREIALANGRDPNANGQQQPGQGRSPAQQKGQGGSPNPRQQPGEAGQQPGQPGGRQPGQQGQQGQQPGQQGQQPGQQGQQGQQPGQQGQQGGQPGQQPGQGGRGSLRGGQQQAGGANGGGGNPAAGVDRLMEGVGRPTGPAGPIAGEGFRQWSDRMRDVEELLQDPGLRSEAARIRDRVRGAREELKRHSKEPDWVKLQGLVAEPIRELRDRVAEEVRKRESPDALVPIDRDPVPAQFAEGVRRYYERLGSGR